MVSVLKERRRRGPKPARQLTSAVNSASSPKRKHLTYHDKLGILDYCHANPHLTQSDIAQYFQTQFPSITQATISRYLTQEQELRRYVTDFPQRLGYTRPIQVALPAVETALSHWVDETLDHGRAHLSGRLICEKARQFHQLLDIPDGQRRNVKFSSGWLTSFKERMGLRRIWYHGEAASAPLERIDPEIKRLQPIIGQYALSDVYDFDETALFFRAAPRSGLSNRPMPGVKEDKTRLTYGLCVNVDGSDKRPPFILGKVTKPRCFKGRTGRELGFDYDVNPTAWMTEIMWNRWLARFDADMRRQNRHVLLLCDNASSHKKPKRGQYPNPLDAGIIRCFKAHYRRALVQRAIERIERGEAKIYHVEQLEAMRMAQIAWDAVSPSTITNCWHHTGICPPSFQLSESASTPGLQDTNVILGLQSALDQLVERCPDLAGSIPSARRFVDSDDSFPTEPEPSEEEIARQLSQTGLVTS